MAELTAFAVAAVVLLWPARSPWRRLRSRAPAQRPVTRVRLVPLLVAGVVLAVLSGLTLDSVRGAVLGLAFGASAAVIVWTVTHARRARARSLARDDVARGSSELAALLRAGHPPGRALRLVGESTPLFAEPASHFEVGGDPTEVLERLSQRAGCAGLASLAGAWRVSEATGASMTPFLDELATALTAERELGLVVETELAAPRMTGRLLGMLPLVGLGLGFAVGGDPVGYLIGSLPGLICLGVGIALAVAGVVWSEKLADRAGELR